MDPNDSVKVEQLHLYAVTNGQNFAELNDDDETVESCKIRENDSLYLLTYRWTCKLTVTVKKSGSELCGVDPDDTCLGIKVKVQDQMGLPVNTLKVFREHNNTPEDFFHGYPREEFSDEVKPFISCSAGLTVITEEELPAEIPEIPEELEAEGVITREVVEVEEQYLEYHNNRRRPFKGGFLQMEDW